MTLHLPAPNELGLTDLDTEIWITRTADGLQPIRVDDMTVEHRAAVLRWIRNNAVLLNRHQRWFLVHLRRTGAISYGEFDNRLRVLDHTAPEVWVEDTRLVRRLVELAPRPDRAYRRAAQRLLPTRLRFPLGARR